MEGFRLVVAGPDGVRELTDEQFFKLIPRGCRFCPTDEDLIYYIKDKALKKKLPFNRIKDVNIYHCDPEHLIEKFRKYGEKEWYFFTPRDRKYPNGKRPNRKAGDGFWKATGVDKKIYTGNQHIGDKKALVYYEGKPPGKNKTDWIMYEYRLAEGSPCTITGREDMRLDDCVLCRIHKKPKSKNRLGQNANKDSAKISVEDTSLVNDSDPAKVASDEDGTLSNDSGLPTSEFDEEYENDAGSSTLEDTRTVNDPSSLGMMNHCNGMNYHGFDNSQNNSGNNHGFDNSQNNSCNNHGLDRSLQYSLCPFPSQTDYMATSNVVNVQNPTDLVTPVSIKPLMSLQHNNQQFTHANGFGSVSSGPPTTENNQQSKFELTYFSHIDELVGPDWLQDFDFDAFNDLPGPTADVTGPQDDVSQPSLKEPTPQDDIFQPPLNVPKLRDDGSQPPLNKRPRYK